jgi:hypothetical protein
MHPELRSFLSNLAGVATAALAPVVFTAFVSLPWTLNRLPGEPVAPMLDVARHMT